MVEIVEVDFEDKEHCDAVIELMNHYMQDDMGGKIPPHNKEVAIRLINGLKNHCNKLCLLAREGHKYIGLTNCFIGFGTFAAKPFINIHDIVVKDGYRGKGIGRLLLEKIKEKAIEIDCGKITLEVREDNSNAQHLYNSMGFKECDPPMHFWSKYL